LTQASDPRPATQLHHGAPPAREAGWRTAPLNNTTAHNLHGTKLDSTWKTLHLILLILLMFLDLLYTTRTWLPLPGSLASRDGSAAGEGGLRSRATRLSVDSQGRQGTVVCNYYRPGDSGTASRETGRPKKSVHSTWFAV
jgi:hypothetical protein